MHDISAVDECGSASEVQLEIACRLADAARCRLKCVSEGLSSGCDDSRTRCRRCFRCLLTARSWAVPWHELTPALAMPSSRAHLRCTNCALLLTSRKYSALVICAASDDQLQQCPSVFPMYVGHRQRPPSLDPASDISTAMFKISLLDCYPTSHAMTAAGMHGVAAV
jgi:hypothetical protein